MGGPVRGWQLLSAGTIRRHLCPRLTLKPLPPLPPLPFPLALARAALSLPVLPHGSSSFPTTNGREPSAPLASCSWLCPLVPSERGHPYAHWVPGCRGHRSPEPLFCLFSSTHGDLFFARWGLGAGTHRYHSLCPWEGGPLPLQTQAVSQNEELLQQAITGGGRLGWWALDPPPQPCAARLFCFEMFHSLHLGTAFFLAGAKPLRP